MWVLQHVWRHRPRIRVRFRLGLGLRLRQMPGSAILVLIGAFVQRSDYEEGHFVTRHKGSLPGIGLEAASGREWTTPSRSLSPE